MALAGWLRDAVHGRPLRILGSPDRTRDITDVRDVVPGAGRAGPARGPGARSTSAPGGRCRLAAMVAARGRRAGMPVRTAVQPAGRCEVADTRADTRRLRGPGRLRPGHRPARRGGPPARGSHVGSDAVPGRRQGEPAHCRAAMLLAARRRAAGRRRPRHRRADHLRRARRRGRAAVPAHRPVAGRGRRPRHRRRAGRRGAGAPSTTPSCRCRPRCCPAAGRSARTTRCCRCCSRCRWGWAAGWRPSRRRPARRGLAAAATVWLAVRRFAVPPALAGLGVALAFAIAAAGGLRPAGLPGAAGRAGHGAGRGGRADRAARAGGRCCCSRSRSSRCRGCG